MKTEGRILSARSSFGTCEKNGLKRGFSWAAISRGMPSTVFSSGCAKSRAANMGHHRSVYEKKAGRNAFQETSIRRRFAGASHSEGAVLEGRDAVSFSGTLTLDATRRP